MTLPERTNSTPKSSACRRKYEYVAVDEDVAEDVAVAVAVDVAQKRLKRSDVNSVGNLSLLCNCWLVYIQKNPPKM